MRESGLWIWLGAALLYLVFRAWYDGWRGALTPEEVEVFLKRMEGSVPGDPGRLETLRSFLEQDDGREFVMMNLVRLAPEPVPHPETGVPTPGPRLLREYLRGFFPLLIRRAGHPVFQAAKVGGYLDAWQVESDPGWSFVGAVRYRSRRDMLELATHPRFTVAHPFKVAAMSATCAFPTSPRRGLYAGPRVWAALVLALLAALAHLAWWGSA